VVVQVLRKLMLQVEQDYLYRVKMVEIVLLLLLHIQQVVEEELLQLVEMVLLLNLEMVAMVYPLVLQAQL